VCVFKMVCGSSSDKNWENHIWETKQTRPKVQIEFGNQVIEAFHLFLVILLSISLAYFVSKN